MIQDLLVQVCTLTRHTFATKNQNAKLKQDTAAASRQTIIKSLSAKLDVLVGTSFAGVGFCGGLTIDFLGTLNSPSSITMIKLLRLSFGSITRLPTCHRRDRWPILWLSRAHVPIRILAD